MNALIYSITLTLLLMSLIHFYWAFGGKAGIAMALPVDEDGKFLFYPPKTMSLVVAILLFISAFLVYNKLYMMPLTPIIENYALYVVAGLFLIRSIGDMKYVGVIKKYDKTEFGELDKLIYSPLCLLLGAGIIFIEWTL